MSKLSHGLDHVSKRGMIDFIAQNWDSVGFSTVAENFCKRDLVCVQHNVGKSHNTTQSAFSIPKSPFQHNMMDFTELIPARGYKYCRVVDMFSKWVEAFPCKHQNQLLNNCYRRSFHGGEFQKNCCQTMALILSTIQSNFWS